MKRNALLLVATAFVATANIAVAGEAQPELQPTRVEFGSFKFPVDATQYRDTKGDASVTQNQYRFLTDASPL